MNSFVRSYFRPKYNFEKKVKNQNMVDTLSRCLVQQNPNNPKCQGKVVFLFFTWPGVSDYILVFTLSR